MLETRLPCTYAHTARRRAAAHCTTAAADAGALIIHKLLLKPLAFTINYCCC
jgi:hypothetical protein